MASGRCEIWVFGSAEMERCLHASRESSTSSVLLVLMRVSKAWHTRKIVDMDRVVDW